MTINMVQIGSWFGSLVALWAAVKLKYKEWQPVIQPMIEEAENDAKDGVIDAADRKHIVMIGIAAAEKDGGGLQNDCTGGSRSVATVWGWRP